MTDLPAKIPPVTDPFLQFHDLHAFLTAAYSSFTAGTPKLKDYFVIKTIDQTTLFSCKTCKRTYLSEDSALRHFCNQETKSKSFVNLSSSKSVTPSFVQITKIVSEAPRKVSRDGNWSDPSDGHKSSAVSDGNKSDALEKLQTSIQKTRENTLETSTKFTDENGNANTPDTPEVIWESSHTEKTGFYFRRQKDAKSNRKRRKERVEQGECEPEKKYVCEVCGSTFGYSSELMLHRSAHHPEQAPLRKKIKSKDRVGRTPEKYICEVCGSVFAYSGELILHRDTHFPGTTSEVNQVPTVAADIHVQEQKHMYVCSFCQMSFTRKTTLLSHEQDHLEKSFRDSWSDDGTNA